MPVDRLIQLVERWSDQLRQSASDDRRKAMGQYYTAVRIAEFMASLPDMPGHRHVRVLDPGAGAGILGICAARSPLQRGAESVHVVAVERDTDSVAALNQSLSAARRSFGARFSYEVRSDDFLNSTGLTLGREPIDPVDIAISNPPYFKVTPSDPRGGGAPNIYAQFMSVASQLLKPGGQICFIVPRSYSSGLYFRDFRRRFHRTMALEAVHLFRSRADAFKNDGVLQENIIILCRRGDGADDQVRISVSNGTDDLPGDDSLLSPRDRIVDPDTQDAWLYLPESRADLRALKTVEHQPNRLADFGWAISTGPVVAFRAAEHLRGDPIRLRRSGRSHAVAATCQARFGGMAIGCGLPEAAVVIRRGSGEVARTKNELRLAQAILRKGRRETLDRGAPPRRSIAGRLCWRREPRQRDLRRRTWDDPRGCDRIGDAVEFPASTSDSSVRSAGTRKSARRRSGELDSHLVIGSGPRAREEVRRLPLSSRAGRDRGEPAWRRTRDFGGTWAAREAEDRQRCIRPARIRISWAGNAVGSGLEPRPARTACRDRGDRSRIRQDLRRELAGDDPASGDSPVHPSRRARTQSRRSGTRDE